MEFVTRRNVSGYQVCQVKPFTSNKRLNLGQMFFARKGKEVVIRARSSQSGSLYELLPRELFVDDFPVPFVEGYSHWLHLDNRRIELRDNDSLLNSSQRDWVIDMTSCRMYSDSCYAIDIRSDTFKMMSARLSSLEDPNFVYLTYSRHGKLRAYLPRFKLTFFLADGELSSENIENMVVDSNNSSGTMIGLRRQLVLIERPSDASCGIRPNRCVLIPVGRVSFRKHDTHVWVDIDNPRGQEHIRYLAYSINTDLQRLDGSGSFESTLYKIYLHALTSSCLPDPLTQRTGTTEALTLLYSPASVSFQRLQEKEEALLHLISQLTPRREYYLPHIQNMQTIHWLPLHVLSQLESFEYRVRQIFRHAEHLGIFEHNQPDYSNSVDPISPIHLLQRASASKQIYYPWNLNWFSTIQDSYYLSRDVHLTDEDNVVHGVSRIIAYQLGTVDTRSLIQTPVSPLSYSFDQWVTVVNDDPNFSLSYRRAFVEEEPSSLLLPFLSNIVHPDVHRTSFALLFSICAFAYQKPQRHLIPCLVAFAVHPEFGSIDMPTWSSYDLSRGKAPDAERISTCLSTCTRQLKDTPLYQLWQESSETPTQFEARQKDLYKSECQQSSENIAAKLIAQWPCQSPTLPPGTDYHDTSAVSKTINALYQSWFKNHSLYQYLKSVQRTFDSTCFRAIERHRVSRVQFTQCFNPRVYNHNPITLVRLFQCRPAPVYACTTVSFPRFHGDFDRLTSMLGEPSSSAHPLQQDYLSLLRSSHKALLATAGVNSIPHIVSDELLSSLTTYYKLCGDRVENIFRGLHDALRSLTVAEISVDISGRWPQTTCSSLVGTLALSQRSALPHEWKEALVTAAISLARYQQARRLLRLGIERRYSDLFKELQNNTIDRQKLYEFPDWLLIQVRVGRL